MASYNHEEFVRQALETVLQQGVKNLEVIVVDDGSTDNTPDVVSTVTDPRIKLIRVMENRRLHPRNLGIEMASGRYIAFQNSDDEWAPGKLEAQIKVLDENPNIVACFTGVELIDEKGLLAHNTYMDGVFTTENRSSDEWLRSYFENGGHGLCISSSLVRSQAIRKLNGFCGNLIQLGDFDLWVRLAAMGDFHIIEDRLTRMRILGTRNVSAPSSSTQRRNFMELTEVLMRYGEYPVIDRIAQAFHENIPQNTNSRIIELAGLALCAYTGGGSYFMFADRVLSKLIDDPQSREEITAYYGEKIVQEFIKRRGQISVILNEDG